MDRATQVIAAELETAKRTRQQAATAPYAEYVKADAAVDRLEAELKIAALGEQGIKPESKIHLAGNTFKHKDAIKRAGGVWHSITRTWVIAAKDYAGLSLAGVYTTTEGAAALATMGRADSAF